MNSEPSAAMTGPTRWQRVSAATLRAFHAYAAWLVGISWKLFFLLAVLLLIVCSLLEEMPPFSWKIDEHVTIVDETTAAKSKNDNAAKADKAERKRAVVKIDKPAKEDTDGVQITIDAHGVRIVPQPKAAASAASAAPADAASAALPALPPLPALPEPPKPPAPPAAPGTAQATADGGVEIRLPPGADSAAVKEAVEDARKAVVEAIRDAAEARADAEQAASDARQAIADAMRKTATDEPPSTRRKVRVVRLGEFLPDLALLWIFASAILKLTYKRQVQAEARAAEAVETAEAESLKRQVVEARMAAMQAQVEPHFLFNTLASIDHLIETDPPRASAMQKNLIALLRASMPTMRETSAQEVRTLGRELAVIKPYLEILKVRMEDRLDARVEVSEGLHSAQFPSMMLQSLVENAIKHGLEPKPEGGSLRVRAEVSHGKLVVSVADTGLGFGKAATAGTGVGLENIRERLKLAYGNRAALTITENQPSGTVVKITVPYKPPADEGAPNPAFHGAPA